MTSSVSTLLLPSEFATLCDDVRSRVSQTRVAGKLGGKVGVAPRIFLKKLVGELLDRVDQFEDFDPRSDYVLTLSDSELSSGGAASHDRLER